MAKSLLYRIFGLGQMPQDPGAALESEGVILLEEGIRGSITYKRFRAPGRYSSWRRQTFAGSLVITRERVVAFAFSRTVVNVPFKDPKFEKLHVSVENEERLLIAFKAEDFHDDRSGSIEIRYRTPQARLFEERLTVHR